MWVTTHPITDAGCSRLSVWKGIYWSTCTFRSLLLFPAKLITITLSYINVIRIHIGFSNQLDYQVLGKRIALKFILENRWGFHWGSLLDSEINLCWKSSRQKTLAWGLLGRVTHFRGGLRVGFSCSSESQHCGNHGQELFQVNQWENEQRADADGLTVFWLAIRAVGTKLNRSPWDSREFSACWSLDVCVSDDITRLPALCLESS